MLSKSSSNPKHKFLHHRNKKTYFSLANKIVTVPILMNKDVFEPSYNDLKLQLRCHQPNIYFKKGKRIERGRDDCGLPRWHYW